MKSANNSLQATRDGGSSSASRFTLVGPAWTLAVMAQAASIQIVRPLRKQRILVGLLLGTLVGALFIFATSIDVASRARWIFSVACPIVGLFAVLALGFLPLPLHAGFRRRFPDGSLRLRRVGLVLGVIFLASLATVMLYDYGVQSLKFHYLIQRVESAKTSQEERSAFELAAHWGHVWELNRLTKREWLPARAQALQGNWVLELEWLESSAWTGKPFRAYRVVLDEKNLEATYDKGNRK
jgi:hypothetical protein